MSFIYSSIAYCCFLHITCLFKIHFSRLLFSAITYLLVSLSIIFGALQARCFSQYSPCVDYFGQHMCNSSYVFVRQYTTVSIMACIAFRVSFPTVLPSRSTLVQSILLLFSIALKCLEVFSLHTVVIFNFCKYSLFNSHRVKVLTPSEYVMSIRPFCVVLCQTTVYIEFCFVLSSIEFFFFSH